MNKFLNFLEIEKKIWGENLVAAPLFDAIILLFVMVCGAFGSASNILVQMFNLSINIPQQGIIYGVIISYLYMLAESVFGAKNWKVAVIRPILLAAEVTIAYILGYVLSAIILALAALALALILFSVIMGMITDNVTAKRIHVTQRTDGDWEAEDGKIYKIGADGKARERKDLLG